MTNYFPIIGDGYYPLDQEALAAELGGASIIHENDMFGGFRLILGFRDPAYTRLQQKRQAFLCIQSKTSSGPHLFIVEECE